MSSLSKHLAGSRNAAFLLVAAQIAILTIGSLRVDAEYSDFDFAAKFAPVLLVVTGLFVAVTILLGTQRSEIGMRAPELHRPLFILPGAVLLVVGAAAFAQTWFSLPDNPDLNYRTLGLTLLTTMLVGFTEEWMFRGLLLVALVRWLGFRKGSLVGAVAFGVLHIVNLASGQPLAATLQQVLFTTMLGFTFYLMVIGTRSLIPGMIVHGLYDFFLISQQQLEASGAVKSTIAMLPSAGVSLTGAVVALVFILRGNSLGLASPKAESEPVHTPVPAGV